MDLERFRTTQFKKRTKQVAVPLLKEFLFSEGEEPLWEVQALSTEEIAIVKDAASKNKMVGQMVVAMMGGNHKDKINAMLDGMGMNDEQPETVSRDIEVVLYGSVELDPTNPQHRDVVIKLAENFPVEFGSIANAIWALVGEGPELTGKPPASTPEKTSKSP